MVTLHAKSFEHVAVETPLRFPPPMVERADRQDSYEFHWHLLQYGFGIVSPTDIPPFEKTRVPHDDSRVVRRYIQTAEHLAASSMLTADEGATISVRGDEQHVEEHRWATPEAEAGFTAIFRQMYRHTQDASHSKVQRIAMDAANAAADNNAAERLTALRGWADAIRITNRQTPKKTVLLKLIDLGLQPPATEEELRHFPDREPPETLINRYFNTEHLHWDSEKARALEERAPDRVRDVTERLDYYDAARGLSHLYIGYAEVVRRLFHLE